jgi:hypothetical protein
VAVLINKINKLEVEGVKIFMQIVSLGKSDGFSTSK